jgi:phosphoesterase RecJ-like protein
MLLGVTPDVPMANALYTAVSTDTGCFRYANTTEKSYLVAAACKAVSPDLTNITRELFDTVTFARLKLQSWLVENMILLHSGTVAICAIPLSLKAKLGLTEADLENISGFPRSIAGVKIAATLREEEVGPVKLSVRAVPGYDAAAICEKFGGGGHKGAAGAGLDMTLQEALEAVKAVL